jgi:hypothetical protein
LSKKDNMSSTIEDALSGAAIAKSKATQSGYSFWLKGLPTEIQVVLSINGERGGFNFQTSHVIHTPKQAGPYHPSRPWGDDAAYALHLAVTSITQYFEEATKAGLPPDGKWLIPSN